ncbi:hypothetical protein Tco_1136760 [Tanacetum coccineum]
MTKMAKAKRNVLNAVIQIILLVNVQKRRESIIKELLLEDVGRCWSDSDEYEEKKTNDEKYLMAKASNEQAASAMDTAMGEPLGLGYGALRRHELAVEEDRVPSTFEVDSKDGRVYTDIPAYVPSVAPVQTPPSPEWLSGSLLISPSSTVALSPIASPVATQQPPSRLMRISFYSDFWGFVEASVGIRGLGRMHLGGERRERLELADHVAMMERKQESREE